MRRLVMGLVLLACSKDEASIRPDDRTADGGTGDPVPGADTHVSGSRLKRRIFKGVDGSQQFAGWFDSERNAECTFQFAADNKLRCLPLFSVNVSGYFEDAACMKPLATTSKGCVPVTVQRAAGTCSSRLAFQIFSAGTAFTGDTVYVQTPTGCISTPSASPLTGQDFYSIGAEIAPSSFVEAVEERL